MVREGERRCGDMNDGWEGKFEGCFCSEREDLHGHDLSSVSITVILEFQFFLNGNIFSFLSPPT